jgi:hypothetical protein
MIPNRDGAENPRSCTDVDMPSDPRRSWPRTNSSDGHLLKDQAVGPDTGIRMHDNPVRVWQEKPTPN